jgi:hypothetical protein
MKIFSSLEKMMDAGFGVQYIMIRQHPVALPEKVHQRACRPMV